MIYIHKAEYQDRSRSEQGNHMTPRQHKCCHEQSCTRGNHTGKSRLNRRMGNRQGCEGNKGQECHPQEPGSKRKESKERGMTRLYKREEESGETSQTSKGEGPAMKNRR